MSEFFRGWKRKLGAATLLMALVFLGGWVRSYSTVDWTDFSSGNYQREKLESRNGAIYWESTVRPTSQPKLPWVFPKWCRASLLHSGYVPIDDLVDWRWEGYGFRSGVIDEYDGKSTFQAIPYWSIVIPLTLISLWLLLSKRPKSNQKKITEPAAKEGM